MTLNPKRKDLTTEISFFKKKVKHFVQKRNWSKYHTPKNLIQAMTIELGELSELFLFKEQEIADIKKDEDLFQKIQEELADVFIYLISFANSLDIDLSSAFIEKMAKNRQKYSPEEFSEGYYYKK
jgi:NTP pyrophosphatase (non-canonical NTP hydrolase)